MRPHSTTRWRKSAGRATRTFVAGVVAGTGLDIRMSPQRDLTLDLQSAHELTSESYREIEFGGYRMTSLLVGVAYRR